ncbi:RNA pseudouridine synthase [Aerococcus urinaehominis]|uniref:Pseudouridine synthase n=1 Tax=Aerococcus urinaehominis TaxID=128944 RepID=A0A120IB45_9LACT|nr:RNA pseudouridine synthase [Aerococcus urinaehominis]
MLKVRRGVVILTVKFTWTATQNVLLKSFLQKQGVSRRLLAKLKYHGGQIKVNNHQCTVRYQLEPGDQVTIVLPKEGKQEIIEPISQPIDILYEDEHLIAVNKPAGYTSIPSQYNPQGSMANILKAYYQHRDYDDQMIHVITRLDRDTSGIMLFARHRFAHAMMDQILQKKEISRQYIAFNRKKLPEVHGFIEAPITRKTGSIIERQVGPEGKYALTEYQFDQEAAGINRYRVKLHTGRTHQIRVHFAYQGAPLLGDELYGGQPWQGLNRQALHCHQLSFIHPFTQHPLTIEAPLANDLSQLGFNI